MSRKKSGRKPASRPAAEPWLKKSNVALVVVAAVLVGVAAGAVLFGGGAGGSGSSGGTFAGDKLGSGIEWFVEDDSLGIVAEGSLVDDAGSLAADVRSIAEGEFLAIRTDEIGDEAAFFPVDVDGTPMELLAVRASDGSIRTAFNTCQSCYRSGRGYYKWDGGELVCQNCGFRFSPDQVEVQSGGCNPWPIFDGDKTVTEDEIRVSYDFLKESSGIFANWKV